MDALSMDDLLKPDTPYLERITLRAFEIAAGAAISEREIQHLRDKTQVRVLRDEALRSVLVKVAVTLLAGEQERVEESHEVVEHPENWWQAVKDRWFPGWLRRWSPVAMTVHRVPRTIRHITRCCPHLPLPPGAKHRDKDYRSHFAFMLAKERRAGPPAPVVAAGDVLRDAVGHHHSPMFPFALRVSRLDREGRDILLTERQLLQLVAAAKEAVNTRYERSSLDAGRVRPAPLPGSGAGQEGNQPGGGQGRRAEGRDDPA